MLPVAAAACPASTPITARQTEKITQVPTMGGPIYNSVGLLLSVTGYRFFGATVDRQGGRGWSALGHGLLVPASLAPVSFVDGDSILKWTLISRGKTPGEADRIVRRVAWGLGAADSMIGVAVVGRRKWVPGLVMMGAADVVASIAAGTTR